MGKSILSQLFQKVSVGGGGTYVGLSIGSSAVKLIEMKKSGKNWKLLHFGVVQLAEDVVVNREIVNSTLR